MPSSSLELLEGIWHTSFEWRLPRIEEGRKEGRKARLAGLGGQSILQPKPSDGTNRTPPRPRSSGVQLQDATGPEPTATWCGPKPEVVRVELLGSKLAQDRTVSILHRHPKRLE